MCYASELESYRDAQDSLVSMQQSGCADARRISRTHLDRSVSELRALGTGFAVYWADHFNRRADEVEADMQHAEALMRRDGYL